MIMGEISVVLAIFLTIIHVLGKLKAGNIIVTVVLAASGELDFETACTLYE